MPDDQEPAGQGARVQGAPGHMVVHHMTKGMCFGGLHLILNKSGFFVKVWDFN
jgi:hypothetical protein